MSRNKKRINPRLAQLVRGGAEQKLHETKTEDELVAEVAGLSLDGIDVSSLKPSMQETLLYVANRLTDDDVDPAEFTAKAVAGLEEAEKRKEAFDKLAELTTELKPGAMGEIREALGHVIFERACKELAADLEKHMEAAGIAIESGPPSPWWREYEQGGVPVERVIEQDEELTELKSLFLRLDGMIRDLSSYPMDHGLRVGMNDIERMMASNRGRFSV